jgi:hypothetical protein
VPGQDMAAELRRRGIDLVETESRPDEPLPVA